jgi:ferritin
MKAREDGEPAEAAARKHEEDTQMLDKRIEDAINDQINFELYSAYIYYSMQSWFESKGMDGMATWMAVQVKEEMCHAQIMFNFVNERGGRVLLKGIDGPGNEWNAPVDAFRTALEHEQIVTARINKIMDLALELKDHATAQAYQWFVAEQVEEEASASDIVAKLEWAADAPGALYQIDRELGARVFNLPSPLAAGA